MGAKGIVSLEAESLEIFASGFNECIYLPFSILAFVNIQNRGRFSPSGLEPLMKGSYFNR